MQGSISLSSELYPGLLKKIQNAPKELYYKGILTTETFAKCAAVVGSRKLSLYGERAIKKLVPQLVSLGYSIVSGFMTGADTVALETCIEFGGRPIAVLPCGINRIYPVTNKTLYSRVQETGIVLSEHSGDELPKKWMFVKRNRIVAGIPEFTLIAEADVNSGTLITANLTKDFNKRVYCIPRSIFSVNSAGIFSLLKNGARLCTTVEDIQGAGSKRVSVLLKDNKQPHVQSRSDHLPKKYSQEAKLIYRQLCSNCNSIENLVAHTKLNYKTVVTALTRLQLDGYVLSRGALFYAS